MTSAFFTRVCNFYYWKITLPKVTLVHGKVVLIKFTASLMMSEKLATLGLLERTAFPEKRLLHQLLMDQATATEP